MALEMPYLEAIQSVPGDTPAEKYQWLARFVRDRIRACGESMETMEGTGVPEMLTPLVKVEAAKILKQGGGIVDALKSEDSFIVNRALQASWFFDGSNRSIVNVDFYMAYLFPYVSLNTRIRIIKNLGLHLARKAEYAPVAQEFFLAITKDYGIYQAMNLLPACNEDFVYQYAVNEQIVLPQRVLKTMYAKNPNFVIRYLRLSKTNSSDEREIGGVNIIEHTHFLKKLVNKYLDAFVELLEMHETSPPNMVLSNKSAQLFLKNGKEHLKRKPRLFINFLPLKLISPKNMETIFPQLLPEKFTQYNTDSMLKYLEYYPEKQRYDLLARSYKQVYGKHIVDNTDEITTNLMKLLPTEERARQARIKIDNMKDPRENRWDLEMAWRCYLPSNEAISGMKKDMGVTSDVNDRIFLLRQMIYTCKINEDDGALLDILKYINVRHRNERTFVMDSMLTELSQQYDLAKLSEEIWGVLYDIIRRCFVKKDITPGNDSTTTLLTAAVHFNLLHGKPLDQVIDMLVTSQASGWKKTWNILQKYPEYERTCLLASLEFVKEKIDSEEAYWKERRSFIVASMMESIFDFNQRQVKPKSRVERVSLLNYPWLVNAVKGIVIAEGGQEHRDQYIVRQMKNALEHHEEALFESWFPKIERIADVTSGKGTMLLKKDPQAILKNWKKYLDDCYTHSHQRRVQTFILASRWYKDIPIKFARECLVEVEKKKNGTPFELLGLLLHGNTFTKLIEPMLPTETHIDIGSEDAGKQFDLISDIPRGIRLANPPIPFSLIEPLCQGEYFQSLLRALTNMCRRVSVTKIVPFARNIGVTRVTVKKLAIRVVCMAESIPVVSNFLLVQWNSEQHHSVREIIFQKIDELFFRYTNMETWSLLKSCIRSLKKQDEPWMNVLTTQLWKIPNEYIAEYIQLLFDTYDQYPEVGWDIQKVQTWRSSLLNSIGESICKLLPKQLCEKLITKFLFDSNEQVASASRIFLIVYLFLDKDDVDSRLNVFTDVFVNVTKNGWDHPGNGDRQYYPVNDACSNILHLIVLSALTRIDEKAKEPTKRTLSYRVVNGVLKAFLSVLQPEMAPAPYLHLIFAREWLVSKDTKAFGIRIGQKLTTLTDTFSSMLLTFMAKVMKEHILRNASVLKDTNIESHVMDFMEGVLDTQTREADMMAALFLSMIKQKVYLPRYDAIVERLESSDSPGVRAILYDSLNSAYFV